MNGCCFILASMAAATVLALPGTRVCCIGHTMTIGGMEIDAALEPDGLDQALPIWQGCRSVDAGSVFFMNCETPRSLDGRYFGPFPATSITARVMPLWIDEDGTGGDIVMRERLNLSLPNRIQDWCQLPLRTFRCPETLLAAAHIAAIVTWFL